MSDDTLNSARVKIDSEEADGVTISTYRFVEKRPVARLVPGVGNDAAGAPMMHVVVEPTDVFQIGVELKGGSMLLEPGALQYHHGKISAEVVQHEPGKGFFGRAIASAGTGESAFATKFGGNGTLWCEPKRQNFIVGRMETDKDALLLDDRAFYACTDGIRLSTHRHDNVSGALSGNGLMQPKISGRGVFVVESPVPVDEIDEIELNDGEAVIDGDFMLMFSASLKVSIEPLVRGIRNAMRSGEGLVYKFKGTGTIWVMPTLKI
jgi:uncharacterized protein (AIM24 family)